MDQAARQNSHCEALTILSMPLGPRLVRIASATALAASIFAVRTSFFLALSLHHTEPIAAKQAPQIKLHQSQIIFGLQSAACSDSSNTDL